MKRTWSLVLGAALALATVVAFADRTPTVDPASNFTLPAASGKTINLKDFEGKYVVLEWWNYGCPYVRRHYEGNMQKLQKEFTADGAAWLTIASSAPGKQGHVTAELATKLMKESGGASTEVLLDPDGAVAKNYKAQATPHMFLISPKGEVIYEGAIDNMPRGATADGINYVKQAYAEAKAGKEVSVKKTRPYGCGMKF